MVDAAWWIPYRPDVEIRRIEDGGALAALLRDAAAGPVALDVEADSLHHYAEKVCLVQLSFPGTDALIDPLAGLDLAPMGRLLADPAVRKVLHGADYDLRVLHRDFGFEMRGLTDTMIAARLAGERAFGLAALLDKHFGVLLDKRHQRADWSVRPLPPEMAAYAVLDTRHLLDLAAILEERLTALGRWAWAEEEFRRLEAVRWTGDAADPEAWRRVKGTSGLDRRALAAVRELHAWRDGRARRRDVPPFKILRDEVLVVLATASPEDERGLAATAGLPRALASGPPARDLLGTLVRARALPDSELPEVRRGVRVRPSPEFEARVRVLAEARDRMADALDLEPSLVAPRGGLEAVVRREEEGVPLAEALEVPELRAWQVALLRDALRSSAAAPRT